MSTQVEPIICNTCLGGDDESIPQLTINKISNGLQCKICTLPTTLYHFKSLNSRNLVKTKICFNCAKQRNCCQCCMLDMKWHISLSMRDKLISYLNGQDESSLMTPEATNVMMKRYLALQNGKLGGAKFTSDSNALENLLNQELETSITKLEKSLNSNKKQSTTNNLDIDIKPVLAHLPLTQTLENSKCLSFFLYNIDSSIPEWKIKDAVTSLIGSEKWIDKDSNCIIINHRANAGGIKFSNQSLADKFIHILTTSQIPYTVPNSKLMRGILMVDRFKIFVVPWNSGFTTGSFGTTKEQSLKLARSLKKLIISESEIVVNSSNVNDNDNDTGKKRQTNKKINKKKKKRVTSLKL
ncbi:similar to Saccharomyces cerevisiae YBR065C ECM2 Pre-mRNA splicing factor [Maudiozyma saulgeensis]|uniref:Pre-mRNA-splicing factor SLT11 n=1 Tax=Maudiozyma saulgeensis TaxID=1789683 RepID=A0A1X7R750_9SACH|nr:similar to Saccharomyces cerevisiae YBR065C ECM2 Pre-mRNA splicing factor [Kazachstania saulgeensis]